MGKDKSPEDLVKEKSFEYYKVENETVISNCVAKVSLVNW